MPSLAPLRTETQEFRFGSTWSDVVSFDDEKDLHVLKDCLKGTKDTDFLALHGNGDLYLIEVTDYRKDPAELRKKLENKEPKDPDSLVGEVVQKVRDTLPALIGIAKKAGKGDRWRKLARPLTDPTQKVHVLLWLESSRQAAPGEFGVWAPRAKSENLQRQLKRSLRWLTTKVQVMSTPTSRFNIADVKVRDI